MSQPHEEFTVEKGVLVDITLDFCDLEFSISAQCSATRDDGNECYNTFQTCPVPDDYTHTSGKLYRFTMAEGPRMPGVQAHRHLESIQPISGRIDIRRGLGGRDELQLRFTDERHDDVGVDPYVRRRKTIQGRFWQKLVARNRNYQGRQLLLREGYVKERGRITVSSMNVRRYVLKEIRFEGEGSVVVVARDLLSSLADVKIPAPSDARLAADITAGATSLTLETGHSLTGSSITLRLGDEIMAGSLSGDTVSSLTRGIAGTTAAAHSEDERVQEVKVWNSGGVDDVWSDILTLAGISSGLQDTSGAADVIEAWHPSVTFTSANPVYISKPTTAERLMADLMRQTGCMTWWDPVAQQVKLGTIHPRVPGQTGTTIQENADITIGSVRVLPLEDERITRLAIYYGVEDWSRDFGKQDEDKPAFTRIQVHVDVDAESAEEYGDERAEEIFAYFLGAHLVQEVKAMAFRNVARRRNTPRRIALEITDRKAVGLDLGDAVDLTTDEIVDTAGRPSLTECIVLAVRPPRDGGIDWGYEVEPTNLAGRWAFYQSNSITNTYATATDSEKLRAFYATSAGLMSDGTRGYGYP